MGTSAATPTFQPPAIPWLSPQALVAEPDLGPGLDGQAVELGLQRLCGDPSVQAVLAFGSRLGAAAASIRIWIWR